ncbi:MAG: hypothetical protein AAGA48_11170 [Myxococcota bacterium]
MFERIRFALPSWPRPRAGVLFRYGLIERVQRCSGAHHVDLMAFGFEEGDALRCVLRGESKAVRTVIKGVKVGTALALRHAGLSGGLTVPHPSHNSEPEAIDAVVWAHRAPLAGERGPRRPLATPWSSHRDLLGYREAVFFDAKPLRRAVDPQAVHERCGGLSRPPIAPPQPRRALATLLRVAAAVIGVVPSDRRCFLLFVHLSRHHGWSTQAIARALCLTPRRVRQLAASPTTHLDVARQTLRDPRLQRVP